MEKYQINQKEKYYITLVYIKSQGGEQLDALFANKTIEPNYKKLLNKKDPIDRQILNLVKQGELKVGIVRIKEDFSYIH